MNFPVCGYLNYIFVNNLPIYPISFVCFFGISWLISSKINFKSKTKRIVVAVIISLLTTFVIVNVIYLFKSLPVSDSEYDRFNETLKSLPSKNLPKTDIQYLNNFAECAISDRTISSYEYSKFIKEYWDRVEVQKTKKVIDIETTIANNKKYIH